MKEIVKFNRHMPLNGRLTKEELRQIQSARDKQRNKDLLIKMESQERDG